MRPLITLGETAYATGAAAPSRWCLEANGRAPGDFGVTGQSWDQASRSWLRHVLSDSTDHGAGWRNVLAGAPLLSSRDSIVQVTDERVCGDVAIIINGGLGVAAW